ncbi:MAG TPA: hypothetical protein VFM88_10315 [Vicinamibacteria bacterium]|nr:hypothetical protein [Vicinamibacteria bacterium]
MARSELDEDELDDELLDEREDELLEELDDELLEDELLLLELELDDDAADDEDDALEDDDELSDGVGPVVESPHAPSIPTPARAAPPERIFSSSRRSSRCFESSPAGTGFLWDMGWQASFGSLGARPMPCRRNASHARDSE